MASDPQGKKWQLTWNNPQSYGLTRDAILEILSQLPLEYFCLCDEIATTGTPHTHAFLYAHSNMRFSTIQRKFPTAHIERVQGTARQNRDYIAKEGKWADTEKAETSVAGSFYEWGTLPTEQEEHSPAMSRLLQSVKEGRSTMEIIEETPAFAFKTRDIDTLREAVTAAQYGKENRDLTVYYLYGASGAGKTRSIYQASPGGRHLPDYRLRREERCPIRRLPRPTRPGAGRVLLPDPHRNDAEPFRHLSLDAPGPVQ